MERWHGWGVAPQIFDQPALAIERERLHTLLGPSGYDAAARTTLNAFFTAPELVQAMWSTVEELGVSFGVAFEPGCGRGTFLAHAPDRFVGVGVELDPTTAAIARELIDDRHRVVAGDFARIRLQPASVNVVIGNVPFGRYGLFDPDFNPANRLAIHDHFLVKSLAALCPGGVAVILSSRFTLDKLDASARRAMGSFADFVGAVRLPSRMHQAEAGTQAVTDLLIFRRRADGEPSEHASGFLEPPVPVEDDVHLSFSAYFATHPQHVLGELRTATGQFGPELEVAGDPPSLDALLLSVRQLAADRPFEHLTMTTNSIDDVIVAETYDLAPIGRLERTAFGFRRFGVDGWENHDAGRQGRELGALIDLRDRARALVELEHVAAADDATVESHRHELANRYHRLVERFGPINRSRLSPETGRRSVPRLGGFRGDPDWPRVAALERYDESSGHAAPATLLERRVVVPREPPERAEDPEDALSISLSERGHVDLLFVADLLGIAEADCLEVLGDRVFIDPASERVVIAAEYCAGNVREKLARARAFAAGDGSFERNVAVLEAALPRDVTADELEGTIGAPWLEVDVVAAFASELAPSTGLGEQISVARARSTNEWKVSAPSYVEDRMSADHPFGTSRRSALRVLESCLNGRAPVVTNETPEGKRIVDPEATAAACAKADELCLEFDRWLLHDDPIRSTAALRNYNDRFNSYVPRNYAGMRILAPGLASDFVLHPHQEQAIARMVYGGNSALWHPVGAGKTAEMIVGAMEQRRLGIISRPAFVVPNHMLEQFATEFLRLYPAAEVLTVPKHEISPRERHLFAARARSHDWHAVIITHSSFVRWSVSPSIEEQVLSDRIAERKVELIELQAQTNAAARTLTKRLETAMANYESRLNALRAEIATHQDEHDFYFDQSGIDYLCVDEAQEFKNGEVRSTARNLRGVPVGDGSQRAMDLDTKLRWLRNVHPDRQATMATATPVSNTVAEIWVATRYLRPDLLEAYGVQSFDGFRAAFCDTTSDMELDVTRTFRRVERLSRYKNLPELARLWGEFADIVRIDDLDLPRPALATGRRQVVVVPPAPELELFISEEVRERVEKIRFGRMDRHEDNMLKLSTECRLASFDWESFRGEKVAPEHSILEHAADQVAAIYHANADRPYRTSLGTIHPTLGAFQLVFSDLSTPKGDGTSAYERFREALVRRGLPRDKLHFAHEHDRNDDEKERFFAACRDGRVAVAIASTAKMGMGTNVQDRLRAEHHLDVPWRPTDVEQREGRGIRQGNQNEEVDIYAYAAERSYSVYGWQALERKAGFIGQLMRADPNGPRSLELHDDEALSYGEVKAIVTGDPAFLELARLEDTLAGLERLHRSHAREQAGLTRRIERLEEQLERNRSMIEALTPFAEAVKIADESSPPWRVVIGEHTFDNRGEAAHALGPLLSYTPRRVLLFPDSGIEVNWRPGQYGIAELVANVGVRDVAVKVEERSHDALIGALTRITHAVEDLPKRVEGLRAREIDLTSQFRRSGSRIGVAFPKAEELRGTRDRLESLRSDLAERYGEKQSPNIVAPSSGASDEDQPRPGATQALRSEPREFIDAGEEAAAFSALYGPRPGGPSISIG